MQTDIAEVIPESRTCLYKTSISPFASVPEDREARSSVGTNFYRPTEDKYIAHYCSPISQHRFNGAINHFCHIKTTGPQSSSLLILTAAGRCSGCELIRRNNMNIICFFNKKIYWICALFFPSNKEAWEEQQSLEMKIILVPALGHKQQIWKLKTASTAFLDQ